MQKLSLGTKIIVHSLLICGAIISIMPFMWMVTTSLKPYGALYQPPLLIPMHFEWSNYVEALSAAPFGRFFMNSFIMTIGITVLQTIFSAMAGYAFARLRFPGRNGLFLIVIGTMMIPFPVTLVPNFLTVSSFGWLNTYQALIVPRAVSAFSIMLFRQFFISFPSELEEAAFLDGAGHFRIFWQIALPLARLMIGASAEFSFLCAWNDFLWPLIVSTSPDMMTVLVGLSVFSGRYGTFWTLLAAASVVVCLPAILAFSLAQRQFAQAVTYSGLKE